VRVTREEVDIIAQNVKEMTESIGKRLTRENLVTAARTTADFIIPGGLVHVEAYLRGEISGSEFLVREAWGVATDVAFMALGGPVGKAVKKVGGKIVRQYIGNTLIATERAVGGAALRAAERTAVRRTAALTTERAAAGNGGWLRASIAELNWRNGVTPRGIAFENHLERVLPGGTQRQHFLFKTFDFTQVTEQGIKAISAKTIDTTTEAATRSGSKQVFATVNRYINEMINFESAKYLGGRGGKLFNHQIYKKELQLGIPVNTPPQCERQILQAIENARLNDIDVVVTRIIAGV
jgi:hypothetical protein